MNAEATYALEGHMNPRELDALFDLARQVTEGVIVEIGSYRGQSTCALALGSKAGNGVPVYAIDPHDAYTHEPTGSVYGPQDWAHFYRALIQCDVEDIVRPVALKGEEFAEGYCAVVGLLFIDADHSYRATREHALDTGVLLPSSVIAFDDREEDGVKAVISGFAETGWSVECVGKVAICRR